LATELAAADVVMNSILEQEVQQRPTKKRRVT